MKTIYKYHYNDHMMLPKGAEILSFGKEKSLTGGNDIDIFWAIIDTEAPEETMNFIRIGTGWDFQADGTPPLGKYLGRIDEDERWGMTYRWHIFAPLQVMERARW